MKKFVSLSLFCGLISTVFAAPAANVPDPEIFAAGKKVRNFAGIFPDHVKTIGLVTPGSFPVLKNVLATYGEAEDLINIGAYKAGSNKEIDYAISKINAVNEFLMQQVDEKFTFDETVDLLKGIFIDG